AALEPEAAPATAPGGAAAVLRPLRPELWSEVARDFEVENDAPGAQALRGGYGIHVQLPAAAALAVDQNKLAGARPASEDTGKALGFVAAQLERYPRAFMQRLGFQQLVLIAGLKQKGVATSAFVMAPAGAMFADPRAITDAYRFHHELFH